MEWMSSNSLNAKKGSMIQQCGMGMVWYFLVQEASAT